MCVRVSEYEFMFWSILAYGVLLCWLTFERSVYKRRTVYATGCALVLDFFLAVVCVFNAATTYTRKETLHSYETTNWTQQNKTNTHALCVCVNTQTWIASVVWVCTQHLGLWMLSRSRYRCLFVCTISNWMKREKKKKKITNNNNNTHTPFCLAFYCRSSYEIMHFSYQLSHRKIK